MTRIFIVTSGAPGPEGHESHYTRLLSEAAQARGWPAQVLHGPAPPALLAPSPALPLRALRRLRYELARRARARAYAELFAANGGADARFILHTATYEEIGIAARAFSALSVRRPLGALSIVLRYDVADDGGATAFVRAALAPCVDAAIDLFADSAALRDRLAPLVPKAVGLARPPLAPPPVVSRQPRLGYFGARRAVKGFAHLPALITAARAQRHDLEAFVQCYRHPHDAPDEAVEAAFAALSAMPGVTCVNATLPQASYEAEIAACAVVLMPYDARHYRFGTSGVFIEAAAAGAAALVSAGSWMAREAADAGLTRVFACTWEDAEVAGARAAGAVAVGLAAWNPSAAERAWIAAHTPDRLLAVLAPEKRG